MSTTRAKAKKTRTTFNFIITIDERRMIDELSDLDNVAAADVLRLALRRYYEQRKRRQREDGALRSE